MSKFIKIITSVGDSDKTATAIIAVDTIEAVVGNRKHPNICAIHIKCEESGIIEAHHTMDEIALALGAVTVGATIH